MATRSLLGWSGVLLVPLVLADCTEKSAKESFEVRVGPDGAIETPAGAAADVEGRFATEGRLLESFRDMAAKYWVVAADARRWREAQCEGDDEFTVRIEVGADQSLGALAELLEVVSVFGVEGPLDAKVVVAGGQRSFTMRELHLEAGAHGKVDGFETILSTALAPAIGDHPRQVLMEEASYTMRPVDEELPNFVARMDALRLAGDPVLIQLWGGSRVTVGEIWQALGPWLDAPGWRLHVYP